MSAAINVPVDFLTDEDIPRAKQNSALRMYTTIARIELENGSAVTTLNQLNEAARLSLKTGHEALNILMDAGWVTRYARRNGARNLPSRYVAHTAKQTTRVAA